MRDRLRKYRKENQAEKRFGKDINVSTMDEAPMRKPMSAAETKSVSKAQPKSGASPMSFGAAFAAARKAGDKTFSWKGKSFTTELAGEKKAAPARRAAPAAPARSGSATAARTGQGSGTAVRAAPATPAKKDDAGSAKPGSVADILKKGAAYRNAFQRQDGRAAFSGTRPEAKATPAAPATPPKPSADRKPKVDAVKRVQDIARANSRSLGMRPANFADVTPERRRQIEEAQKRGYAKGGKIDGCAVRGKTKAGRK